jgi:formate/nitrite transporter FocA (FNT family)
MRLIPRSALHEGPSWKFHFASEAAGRVVPTAQASWREYLFNFFLPTLIGNTIGGVLLVALLNHAPVAPDLENSETL